MDALLTLHPRAIWRSVLDQPKSFWCACGYLFFEYVRPQSIYTQIDVVAWPVIFLLLTFIFAEQERQKWLPSGGITLGIAVMAFIVFLSAVFAVNPLISFRHWRDFFDWIIIYFVVRRAVNTEVKLFLFIGLFFLANLKMTQHGFLSWAMRGFVFASWGVTGGPGWFSNSGEFGIQLCIFIPMLVGVALALRQQWSATTQAIIGVIFLTAIGAVIASSSRGAVVGLAAGLLWMAIRNQNFMKYFFRIALLGALLAWVVYINIPDEFMARLTSSGGDTTSLHRLERWKHGWETLMSHPLLGIGLRNWLSYYPQHFTPQIPGSDLVHNIFVEAGAELGFIGLAGFFWLIWKNFHVTRQVRLITAGKNAPFLTGLSYGMDGALVGMLVSSSFVTVFYYPYFWIQCLLVSCLYAATVDRFPPVAAVPQRKRPLSPVRSTAARSS